MALSEFTRHEVERKLQRFCQHSDYASQVGFRFRGNSVTLYRERPAEAIGERPVETPVAQFRLNPASQLWQLYSIDRNRRWHRYTRVPPTRSFDLLLKEIEEGPAEIFWG